MTAQNDRRQFWRAHFHSPVQLVLSGAVTEAELCDISLKGALINAPAGWPGKVGDACVLRLRLGGEAQISMHVAVAYVADGRVGLHCDSIDLDSIIHLRRLVELNAGDTNLLERELSALLRESV